MRIAQINSVFGQGSTGKLSAQIAAEIRRTGGQPHTWFGRGQPGDDPDTSYIGNRAEVLAQVAETRLLDRHGLGSVASTRQLLAGLDRFRPDLVQVHNLHGYYVNYPALVRYLRRRAVPTVWTLHDAWALAGHCTHSYRIGCTRWESSCHDCPQLAEYPTSWGVDRSRANHDLKRELLSGWPGLHLVTPSRWLASLIPRSLLAGTPVDVIANDPNLSVFRPTTSTWRADHGFDGHYVILAVASVWENRKGLFHLRDFEPLLRPDERLVVVGKLLDPDELPPSALHLERTADAVELAAIYSAADVYVNPTLEDTYPTTNLEAMACGTPCITFPSAGSPETIERGWGVVTDEKTPAALRRAIDGVRSGHPPVRLDTPARSMAQRYVGLYESLLGRPLGEA